ncbi:hypothetical protein D4764_08G0006340 [Takifugu flavidus]|uniref:Uncharacterized protein n=1 Tax=Takifugu flavidus TaxID=433684 RepID=A0A5C6MTB7_9TELE|nr:hypothetical protein D4764_08G0006340 [Takifugu flavidus]
MIGTLPHCCSQYCFYQRPSSFSPPPPSCKSKSRLGFITVTAGHSGKPRSQLGGALLAPFPTTLSRLLWDPYPLPILSGGELPSNTLLTTHPPHRSVQKAGPIPPYVVLISTQRPSVKTANYVATRAQFTLNPHMHGGPQGHGLSRDHEWVHWAVFAFLCSASICTPSVHTPALRQARLFTSDCG